MRLTSLIISVVLPLFVAAQYYPVATSGTGEGMCGRAGTITITALPVDPSIFRAENYGIVGDSATDNTDSIMALIRTAEAYYTSTGLQPTVYFNPGYYLTDSLCTFKPELLIRGKSKSNTYLINTGSIGWEPCNLKDITLQDFTLGGYWVDDHALRFDRCGFILTDAYSTGSTYLHNWGFWDNIPKITYKGCDFVYDSVYIAIHSYYFSVDTLNIINCTFNGNHAYHPIRIDKVGRAYIYGNTVSGGITGIFCGSQRDTVIENIEIVGNTVYGQTEEGISLDGFGNNTGLCPVIGQGRIDSAYNDGGALKLKVYLECRQGTHPADTTAPLPISSRTDWTDFYFCFGDGADFEGRYYHITGYDTTLNTLTIDTSMSASLIDSGWTCSVDGGFFNVLISGNTVHDVWGEDSTAGTGISLWQNVFDVDVADNYVYNCAHGITAAGGIMLNLYQAKAWKINVHNNTITNCPEHGANFYSAYSTSIDQYDNIFQNNTLTGATFENANQVRFINSGNSVTP